MSDQLQEAYPETFSAELIQHCINGFVPPRVFQDMAHSTAAGERHQRRFVRLHPHFVSTYTEKASPTAASVTLRLQQAVADSFHVAVDDVECVAWLPCYAFSIAKSLPLHTNLLYQQGYLIGMDAASMAAVVSLQPAVGDCCLDMCCAPAMKLSLIADAVTPQGSTAKNGGVAVGVDVSIDRLFVARAVLQRHSSVGDAQEARCAVALFAADGRHFSLLDAARCLDDHTNAVLDAKGITTWESRVLKRARSSVSTNEKGCRKRPREDIRATPTASQQGSTHVVYASPAARTLLRAKQAEVSDPVSYEDSLQFDRVLVDAECSHDGSLSHINFTTEAPSSASGRQVGAGAVPTAVKGVQNAHRMARMNLRSDPHHSAAHHASAAASTEMGASQWLRDTFLAQSPLAQLQLALLCRGYEILKVGGTLVYSTCSFSFLQNEYILLCFLEQVNRKGKGHARATVCPAFEYPLSTPSRPAVSTHPFVRPACPEELQKRLNVHYNDYSIVERGLRGVTTCPEKAAELLSAAEKGLLGSRFWPQEFNTSFQYIVKICKEAV